MTTLGLVSMELGGATLVAGHRPTCSLSVPPITADKPDEEYSVVILKEVSILISSYEGAVGVNLPSLVENI